MAFFRHVLILEDNPVALFLHQHGVETHRLGESVHLCSSAHQAQQAILQLGIGLSRESALPDLLLVDLHLPGTDGLEFLEEFYGLPQERRKNVCLFVRTTSTHPSDRKRAGAFPIDGYLNKPFDPQQVQQILASVE